MTKTPDKLNIVLIYVVLSAATIIAYAPMRDNDFVGFDDDVYVTENPHVNCGITSESILWAFTKPHCSMWHPLATLSHMLDCELFALAAFWHHLTSLLFHIAGTLLLFGILKKMTAAVWPSAFVAAVFALHPLNVESVAWVAERKNILSGFFWMLTIAAYIQYAEQPGIKRYLLLVLTFCLALMSKPTIVTLPFVLLVLDYWPLNRFQWTSQSRAEVVTNNFGRNLPQSEPTKIVYQRYSTLHLLGEKIPLFILSAILSIITFIAQKSGGVLKSWESFPVNVRISNAPVCYVSYIVKMVYPSRLAILYPHPGNTLPTWQPIVSLLIIVAISAGVIYMARRRGYLVAGWLWYLGTLVLVIGLIQAGGQAMADRYTYLPAIGILIMVAWSAAELADRWHRLKIVLTITAVTILAVLLVCTRTQLRYWQNGFTLFGHAVKVTENNTVMLNNLAWFLATTRDTEIQNPSDAVKYARRACELTNYKEPAILDTLAAAYAAAGRFTEAIETAEMAINQAKAQGQKATAEKIQNRLHLYQLGRPYRQ